MPFSKGTYENLITEQSETQRRLFAQYSGPNLDFDVIIVGSGMGGGILADDLADTSTKRILVLEAGSYLFPTHVYNTGRLPNADVARKYAVKTFTQAGDDNAEYHIHEYPQLNFGGRSIFWSGLIPTIQPWELAFFPPGVRVGINRRLDDAGLKLNASITMGQKAQEIVHALRQSPLADHFIIQETPRALHQPYLTAAGTPKDEFWIEPTGVFNTAELLVNQLGLNPDNPNLANSQQLQVLLNHYLETVERLPTGRYELNVKDVVAERVRQFTASTVVLAAGSIESPKIVRRSPIFNTLPVASQGLVGKGLTDHPTTHWIDALVTHIG
ncbi:MAG: GMC family oxidoreductase N-terminal domain-containing protein, partial [Chloroflexota bacterium]|nr:GMC family oxidoreductase N-terminal domain-containing protein [Chloroflexota bacterium]